MATWKEKGVVPDSDDEESSDFQSVASYGDRGNEERINEFNGQDYNFENENDEEEKRVLKHTKNHNENTQVGSRTGNEQHIANLDTEPTTYSSQSIEDDLNFRSSPPSPPPVFKAPQLVFDIDDAAADERSERKPGSNSRRPLPGNGVPVEEEISKSYVQLSSPLSSLASTPPGSRHSLAPSKPQSSFRDDVLSPSRRELQHSSRPPESIVEDTSMEMLRKPPNFNGRSLRQRNPIQLHPYVVEQEKYRRILKARGMTPMRLAQIQDVVGRRSRDRPSPDADSQTHDSQDVIETEESQAMDFDWDPELPSSAQKLAEDGADSDVPHENSIMNEDEDFPDIYELLQRKTTLPRHVVPKRRFKSYFTKTKQPATFDTNPQPTGTLRRRDREDNIFDVPASPPATSSPFTTAARGVGNLLSRAASVSSKEPTPGWLGQDDFSLQGEMSLPTPMMSTVKPIPDAILVESDSDGEDPFADDLTASSSSCSSSSSSSDESIQIRRIGKKIRGVLPASHLRLDQQAKTQKAPKRLNRDSRSVSPDRLLARRGIALPKSLGNAQSPTISTGVRIPMFLSDDSDGGEEVVDQSGFIMEDAGNELENLCELPRLGSAEEDDRIDAMLPSRKRQSRGLDARPRKKRRVGSTSWFRDESRSHPRQPKITDHLEEHPKPASSYRIAGRRSGYRGGPFRKTHDSVVGRTRKPVAPRLSILDVADEIDSVDGRLPRFIRIASRTARAKEGQGRQSPSKKFVRLANREDTHDAQSVLQDWRDGKIRPKNLNQQAWGSKRTSKPPLDEITNNRQTRLRSPIAKVKPRSHGLQLGQVGMPRRLVVSKPNQTSMDDFVIAEDVVTEQSVSQQNRKVRVGVVQKRQERPQYQGSLARPGQLEASEVDYSRQHPATAFRTTKKALDALYRTSRKRPAPQANLQLSRFLADDDVVRPSIETPTSVQVDNSDRLPNNAAIWGIKNISRCRKRPPQRIDASAALYRQPSEPLILEFLQPAKVQNVANRKLLGLGKLGTSYPCHFDIFPLQSGIFFHESTFIGSGRLSEALKRPGAAPTDTIRPHISFWLAEKEFRWGPWDENVSSEVGVCFDWLLDQLIVQSPPAMNSPAPDVVGVVTFIVDYLQHHVSFTSSQNRQDFVSRMSEVLQEFSSRFDMNNITAEQKQVQRGIEVLARCAVLAMQILQVSRQEAEQSTMMYPLENLLQVVARRCIRLLLFQGLDGIRKVYDDLQYLSFRERGIKIDQYAVQAWVIIAKILDAAQISRGSFWDMTNSELMPADMKNIDDARTMEKVWYTMFSLLPLCEFDEFGVIIPGQRQNASFDNWPLPQQMLRRVFALYASQARQSPSFNDYCRTIVSRCHYLMFEWGWWKCRGVIGTLFDFFASQNLAHLRNEEVYKSPRFLEELDTEPSLAIEPEDRCFHIFLKILALAIKHMRQGEDVKDIRNLVARVLPNHGRQYPKEEDIQQRELASLRNHHDLLCTLYWSAPADQRRSPDLIDLLQKLVIPARSHKAACLINLRAWANLARFVLTSFTTTPSTTTLETYKPIKNWQINFFSELLQQYLGAEIEARRQAGSRTDCESISETRLQNAILTNRRSTMDVLRQILVTMTSCLRIRRDVPSLMHAFNADLVAEIFNDDKWNRYGMDDEMISASIKVLMEYMDKIEAMKPLVANPTISKLPSKTTGSDSQDSQQFSGDLDRQMMIYPLYQKVLPPFAALLRKILVGQLDTRVGGTLRGMVLVWGRMASLITEDLHELKDFVTTGALAVFEHRQQHRRAMELWPFFLLILVEKKAFKDLIIPSFNIGLEWILAVTKPKTLNAFVNATWCEDALTIQLHGKGHYLLVSRDDKVIPLCPSNLSTELAEGPPFRYSWKKPHRLIRAAIKNMREIMLDSSHNGFALDNNLSKREIESLFSSMLLQMMESMKGSLESMILHTNEHSDYVTFCQKIITQVRSQASDIRPLTEFFIHPSNYYWPEKADPKLYGPGLVSYIIRLPRQLSKTSSELFHYLYTGWRNQATCGQLRKYMSFIHEGIKHWDFVQFMLTEFVPATLSVGFNSPGGWILNVAYLPLLASRISKILNKNDPTEATATFDHTVNLLKIIMNGLILVKLRFSPDICLANELSCERGIMPTVCKFWLSVAPPLKNYAMKSSDKSLKLGEVLNALEDFGSQAIIPMVGGGVGYLGPGPFDFVEGKYTKSFAEIMTDDIKRRWRVQEDKITFHALGGPEVITVLGHRALNELVRPLGEVLEGAGTIRVSRIMDVLF